VGHVSGEHATHALPLRYVPGPQAWQVASPAVVQTSSVHPGIVVHALHARSAVALQATLS
jgi:hypothetical protein